MGLFDQDATPSLSDSELIERYRNSHDTDYIGVLFQRYTHLVYGICMKYLKDPDASEDAVMEVFETLLSKLKRHEVEHFKSWLYSVTKNHCLMQLRQQKKERQRQQDYKKSGPQRMEKPEFLHLNNTELKEQQLNRLEEAVEQLPPEQKKCVQLFYYKEKSYKEIVAATDYNYQQVKSYLQNGKRNLKNFLTQRDHD